MKEIKTVKTKIGDIKYMQRELKMIKITERALDILLIGTVIFLLAMWIA